MHYVPVDLWWSGLQESFSVIGAIEPYAHGAEVEHVRTLEGESFLIRRHGPGVERLEVAAACWSRDRHPVRCCVSESATCWSTEQQRKHCCQVGMASLQTNADNIWFNAYNIVSHGFSRKSLLAWDAAFPTIHVDEHRFYAKRQRWRVGQHEPSSLCPSIFRQRNGGPEQAMDASTVLWPLVTLLDGAGVALSRTFVNVGAGTCMPPDPLHQLSHSSQGHGFKGLAVDSDLNRLRECDVAMRNASASVHILQLIVEPLSILSELGPHLHKLFGTMEMNIYPLDILVIDIDACDCLVVEELLQILQPKIMLIEIGFHVPPPFRFSAQHDMLRSRTWLQSYSIQKFNAISGCSLSYALHKFSHRGFLLFQLTDADAVFVHSSIATVIESSLGIRFPQDEFLCYRRSRLFVQMPLGQVREWFFADHPAEVFANIWINLSVLSAEIGRPSAPFSLDY